MARRPRNPGAWVFESYGDDPGAWDLAKEQCRRALYRWASVERYGTYTDLTNTVTAIEWPDGAFTHHGKQIGFLLGQVSMEELDQVEDRPLLSALVVSQDDDRMPSGGFWTLLRDELLIPVPASRDDRQIVWAKELKAAFEYYGTRDPDTGNVTRPSS